MRLAVDLGWTPGCASSGVAPVCKLNPAIRGAFYNGYPNHGGPAHCSGLCHPHLHVSWFAASYAPPASRRPTRGCGAFPVPASSA